ncbi:threonine/homoserine/homoserine lactone efflux protein [Dysgonomonas sp. PH5-45]|uniref:LysE family translocator n=1 Tax=unclassified Dysgonomonas TaxID=2630389 RepID=UPI002473646B|nr:MULTISPECIES: LysE family transporter [unclassified Dysgonomonas]MDH6355231.1 threonine/homoserine/homoserine lactone efflux protein [Dysgonomonas sp. PH5-45]MDH6388146.1 threonine/homoserine/homoserine lactone efflux protein [Dysgonomonas sp. PH5-37]
MTSSILYGILIGILVSAPMGPIGVLCIQRTLNEGRKHGLLTGVGAMLSDMVYAIIAGLGMGFVVEFIENNHYPIQILGSLVLLVFGYFVSKSNPAANLKKQDETKKATPYWKILLSSFFLNLSNIGIFFFFIAMFARFTFISPNNVKESFVGLLSISVGILLWWFLVSYVVNKVSTRFNPRALMVFNRILGYILILIGIIGTISGIYNWINLRYNILPI